MMKLKKKLIPVFDKVKWILFKDLIKAIKLYFKNLEMKNLALFWGMKNMTKLD